MAKSRVAPLKSVTIPLVELAATVLSVKLVNYVKEDLTIPLNSETFGLFLSWSCILTNMDQLVSTFIHRIGLALLESPRRLSNGST